MFIQLSRGKGEYVYIALSQIISVEGNENRTKITLTNGKSYTSSNAIAEVMSELDEAFNLTYRLKPQHLDDSKPSTS